MVLLPSSHSPQRRGGVVTAYPAVNEDPGNSSAPMQVVRLPAESRRKRTRASLRLAQRCDAKARARSAVPRARSARTEILRAGAGLIIKKAARNSNHWKATAAAAASIVAMTSVAKFSMATMSCLLSCKSGERNAMAKLNVLKIRGLWRRIRTLPVGMFTRRGCRDASHRGYVWRKDQSGVV